LLKVHGLWLSMWGAGVEEKEVAVSSRLTQGLLPRLLPNSPEITNAVRELTDAIQDLIEQRMEINLWVDPFPASPYVQDKDASSGKRLSYGTAFSAGVALDELRELMRMAVAVVEAGSHLIEVLPTTERIARWNAASDRSNMLERHADA